MSTRRGPQSKKLRARIILSAAPLSMLGVFLMLLTAAACARAGRRRLTAEASALAVIGGLSLSTFITLVVMPMLYFLPERRPHNGDARMNEQASG